jgi:hypothetical protein
MTEDFVKEVEDMCNVSSMYYNDGMEKGALKEKITTVLEMYKENISIDKIAKIARLSIPETEEIINSNK